MLAESASSPSNVAEVPPSVVAEKPSSVVAEETSSVVAEETSSVVAEGPAEWTILPNAPVVAEERWPTFADVADAADVADTTPSVVAENTSSSAVPEPKRDPRSNARVSFEQPTARPEDAVTVPSSAPEPQGSQAQQDAVVADATPSVVAENMSTALVISNVPPGCCPANPP